jgi:hypothetical protein
MDIRIPIGLLFATLGALLAIYGLFTTFADPAMYRRSLGINVNLWWGLVMLAFGVLMTALGRGGLTTGPAETPSSKGTE